MHRTQISATASATSIRLQGEKRRQMDVSLRWHGGGLLFLLLFSHAFFLRDAGAEVITLISDTFSDKVKEKGTVWFVQFCVPWCKYCKNLGTLWEDLAKAVEGEDEIEVGQVDCSVEKPACNKVDIHSYPTFKVFYEGEEISKYQGPKEVESLKTFVLNAVKNVTQAEVDVDDEL